MCSVLHILFLLLLLLVVICIIMYAFVVLWFCVTPPILLLHPPSPASPLSFLPLPIGSVLVCGCPPLSGVCGQNMGSVIVSSWSIVEVVLLFLRKSVKNDWSMMKLDHESVRRGAVVEVWK